MPPKASQTWTVIKLIEWTAGFLAEKGVGRSRLDAEVLLADLLGLSRVQLYLDYERPLVADELAAFRQRVRRRASREPVAYITGKKEFFSLEFAVDRRALIPRPETEELAELALERARELEGEQLAVLDLGCGSGCLGLAVAANMPAAGLTGVDISAGALALARANAARLGLEGRAEFFEGDLFAALEPGRRFELILANLPYVPGGEFGAMEPDVRDYEPRLALDGGPDGLDVIRRAVDQAPAWLAEGGRMLMEIWPGQAAELGRLAEAAGFGGCEVLSDFSGKSRFAVLAL